MAYTPPAWNALGLAFAGTAYAPPASTSLGFDLSAVTGGGIVGAMPMVQRAATASFAGTVAVTGSAAITQRPGTAASAGQLALGGTWSTTQSPNTTSFSGMLVLPLTGTVAATQSANSTTQVGAVLVSGTATTTQAQNTTAFAGAVAVGDSYYANVSLLLHCNGTNGSTVFADDGPLKKTLTAYGDAAISAATPKWGTGCFSATAGAVGAAASPDTAFGSGDFTVEGWAKTPNTNAPSFALLYSQRDSSNYDVGPQIYLRFGNLAAQCFDATGASFVTTGLVGTPPSAAWFHWAYTRSGNTFRLFVNGVQAGTDGAASGTCGALGRPSVGGLIDSPTTSAWPGQIDDVRVTKGIARYTTNFTPPSAEFDSYPTPPHADLVQQSNVMSASGTATVPSIGALVQTKNAMSMSGDTKNRISVAQTLLNFAQYAHANGGTAEPVDPNFSAVSLLLHFDRNDNEPIFVDSSNYHHGFSATGNARTSYPLNKFGTAGMYRNDGSITTSHPSAFNFSGDFTIEGWVYSNSFPGGGPFEFDLFTAYGAVAGVRVFAYVGGYLAAELKDSSGAFLAQIGVSTLAQLPGTVWAHWALIRAGTSVNLYLNGVQVGSTFSTSGVIAPATYASVGRGDTFRDASQIDEVRVTNGVARYAGTSFTPPTTAFADQGSYPTLSASATQTFDAVTQAAYVFGSAPRTATATQLVDVFAQQALVSPPSRVVQSDTTFQIISSAQVITTADRNLASPGDPYYGDVSYLLHGDSYTTVGSYTYHSDSSKNQFSVRGGTSAVVASSAAAVGGYSIAFAKTSGACITQYAYDRSVLDRTVATTEMRVRFDVLTDLINGTPVPGSPGSYTFDATQQQTGWFFSSGGGGGQISVGLAGHNGLYEADWTQIQAGGSSINFAPYILQIKGYVGDAFVNVFGTHEVTVGWHHIAIVRSGNAVSVYLDGVRDIYFGIPATASFLDETFIAGADASAGFAFKPEHTNLSAIEEMRHTWGVLRYTANFTPPTVAYSGPYVPFAPFTQSALLTGNGPRQVTANKSFTIAQAASLFSGAALNASATQTLQPFAQGATVYGQGGRQLGATQQISPVAQTATAAPRRVVDADIIPQALAAFAQTATATTVRTTQAAQALSLQQAASVVHAASGVNASQTFSFTQLATAQTLLALTQGQIVLSLGQSAQIGRLGQLQGNTLLGPFTPQANVEGATITTSLRGYRVRPEARTYRTS